MFRNDDRRAERLAELIKSARQSKGYSQEGLARLVNASTETIRKIEQSLTTAPSFFLIVDLARVLEVEIKAFSKIRGKSA